MPAFHARTPLPHISERDVIVVRETALPWREAIGSAAPGARDLQSQLKADVYSRRLHQTDKPAAYSPMRGVMLAAIPSAAMWWGIASLVHAIVQHR